MDKPTFRGCYVATLTPFDAMNCVDTGVIAEHTDWLIENGTDGLCPAGTTGEFLFLTHEEKKQVVEATVDAAQGRVPVLAGVWALTPGETEDLAQAAQAAGASGVFLPPRSTIR